MTAVALAELTRRGWDATKKAVDNFDHLTAQNDIEMAEETVLMVMFESMESSADCISFEKAIEGKGWVLRSRLAMAYHKLAGKMGFDSFSSVSTRRSRPRKKKVAEKDLVSV